MGKISVTNFSHKKNKGDHLRHNRVFDPFLKLFLGFHFWTFLKMSKINFPFGFLEKSCYWKMDRKYMRKNVIIYGHKYFN